MAAAAPPATAFCGLASLAQRPSPRLGRELINADRRAVPRVTSTKNIPRLRVAILTAPA